jgi:DNA-binding transcriptional ArsR family regulator
MSIEVETNIEQIKIRVFFSKCTEILAAINLLSEPKHHSYAKEWGEQMSAFLSPQDKKMLELISLLPYQGLEFFELVLDNGAFFDIDILIQKINSYDNDRFIYVLTGEEINLETIREIKTDKSKFDNFINEMPWIYRGSIDIYESIIYDTGNFKERLVNLIKNIDNNCFREKLQSLTQQYNAAVEEMISRLNEKGPQKIAEEIMNKSIPFEGEIKEYIFIPSYFVSPHYVMAYNKYARMFLFDISREAIYRNEKIEKVLSALKIISDKTRLEILRLLILQPSFGKLIANRLQLTTATISHHLDLLRSVNLINDSRDKNTKYFSANTEEIDEVISNLRDYLYNKY